jgi:hypothetical protein
MQYLIEQDGLFCAVRGYSLATIGDCAFPPPAWLDLILGDFASTEAAAALSEVEFLSFSKARPSQPVPTTPRLASEMWERTTTGVRGHTVIDTVGLPFRHAREPHPTTATQDFHSINLSRCYRLPYLRTPARTKPLRLFARIQAPRLNMRSYWFLFVGIALFTLNGCGGSVSANVSSPPITSPSPPVVSGQWVWTGGANIVNQAGAYGT